MIICIIAGGAGTRLWPLSKVDYPKHLLALTGEASMLQTTVARSRELTDTIYIISEQSHSEEVRAQLPDLPPENILVEPGRRGTASCFALALAVLADRHDPDEPVVFCHADHHIVDIEQFAKDVRMAADASVRYRKIALIGVRPTHAATGLGYIERGKEVDGEQELYEVISFKEKPDAVTATRYIKAGRYLWNMGLFAAPAAVFTEAFAQHAPELEQAFQQLHAVVDQPEELAKVYLGLKSQPIDIALLEKTPGLLVVPGVFDWADIGSFYDLHHILQDQNQHTLKGDVDVIDCEDCMIQSTTGKPVIAIGLKDLVVIDTPEGLLVSAKGKSQLVGEAAKRLQSRSGK